MDGNGPLVNSDQYSIIGHQLLIANISAISDGKGKDVQCREVLNNGIVVTGVNYHVEPLGMCCKVVNNMYIIIIVCCWESPFGFWNIEKRSLVKSIL